MKAYKFIRIISHEEINKLAVSTDNNKVTDSVILLDDYKKFIDKKK